MSTVYEKMKETSREIKLVYSSTFFSPELIKSSCYGAAEATEKLNRRHADKEYLSDEEEMTDLEDESSDRKVIVKRHWGKLPRFVQLLRGN